MICDEIFAARTLRRGILRVERQLTVSVSWMSGSCSALPEALVAVGVMTRVEVPLSTYECCYCRLQK